MLKLADKVMPTTCRLGIAFLTSLSLCLTHFRKDVRDILGQNGEILRIRNVSYATGAMPGSQGEYYCYGCPMGTPATVADIEDCGTNATVLVAVWGEFFSSLLKTIFGLVVYCGVVLML